MSMTDPIADFLTRLRNAAAAQHQDVTIPSSKLKVELARILKEQGYIDGYHVEPPGLGGNASPGEQITVTLKYTEQRKPVISGMQRVSRPGQRMYVDHGHIPRIQGGMGTAIISTSRGVMTGHEARQQGIGGEVVARVW
jgi:small subunit ribosomal protein S8